MSRSNSAGNSTPVISRKTSMNDDAYVVRTGGRWQFTLRRLLAVVATSAVVLTICRGAIQKREQNVIGATTGQSIDVAKVQPIPFDQEQWRRKPRMRLGMAKDIVSSRRFVGKSRAQLQQLLGPGDRNTLDPTDRTESYQLEEYVRSPGSEGDCGSAHLRFWFNDDDDVIECRVEVVGYMY
jgi:hypothetical protein